MTRRVLQWVGLLGLAYGAALAIVWFDPERLEFGPRPLTLAEAQDIATTFPTARSVDIPAADGTRLHAWYLAASHDAGRRRLLLYFGSESEQVHWLLARRPALAGWDLLLVDYRGYGLSEGRPTEAAIADDAARWLRTARTGNATLVGAARVVVVGVGLGSLVAIRLAATSIVEGVVLVAPLDSRVAIAQARLPILPMRWIVRERFDTILDAPKVRVPTIFVVAAHDPLVSAERSRRLYKQWGSASRTWVDLPNASRDGAVADPLCWQRIDEFLRAL